MTKSMHKRHGIRRYVGPKRIILLLCFLGAILWAWQNYSTGIISPILIQEYRDSHPFTAIVLFILIYVISVVASLPSLPLNLAAGFFWGGMLGGFYSTVGVTIGGWLSFIAARRLIGQPLTKKFDKSWANKIQTEFDKDGWKFVAFARLNPIIPTGPLNYLLGLTSLSNRGFLWATFIFLLPPSIAVAFIGDTLQTFTTQKSGVTEIVRTILIVSTAVTVLMVLKYATRIFRK